MPKPKKPSAADRTVDMFTGSTNVEAAEQSDVKDEVKEANPSVEANMDRYRTNAFEYQETLSKHFMDHSEGKDTFRLTEKGPHMLLEKKSHGAGEAYGWTGVMFRSDSLEEITKTFVEAYRARRVR